MFHDMALLPNLNIGAASTERARQTCSSLFDVLSDHVLSYQISITAHFGKHLFFSPQVIVDTDNMTRYEGHVDDRGLDLSA